MFKYKRIFLIICTIIYLILTILELIKYLIVDSNIYGLIYLFLSLFIIFLLIPVTYNYKRHFSLNRISKLIIIIIIGFFTSYILNIIVINSLNIIDSSSDYASRLFVIKNILKPVIYSLLIIFTLIESKCLNQIISKIIKKN